MSAGTWSVRPGRFPSRVQGTQGMHQGAWHTPFESAGTKELTPASVERVTKTRMAQQGGRDEAPGQVQEGDWLVCWLDVSTRVTRAFPSEERWPLLRPVCVAFCHMGPCRLIGTVRATHPIWSPRDSSRVSSYPLPPGRRSMLVPRSRRHHPWWFVLALSRRCRARSRTSTRTQKTTAPRHHG